MNTGKRSPMLIGLITLTVLVQILGLSLAVSVYNQTTDHTSVWQWVLPVVNIVIVAAAAGVLRRKSWAAATLVATFALGLAAHFFVGSGFVAVMFNLLLFIALSAWLYRHRVEFQ